MKKTFLTTRIPGYRQNTLPRPRMQRAPYTYVPPRGSGFSPASGSAAPRVHACPNKSRLSYISTRSFIRRQTRQPAHASEPSCVLAVDDMLLHLVAVTSVIAANGSAAVCAPQHEPGRREGPERWPDHDGRGRRGAVPRALRGPRAVRRLRHGLARARRLPEGEREHADQPHQPPKRLFPAAQCFLKAPLAGSMAAKPDPTNCSCAGVPRPPCPSGSKARRCADACPISQLVNSTGIACGRRRGFSLGEPLLSSSALHCEEACGKRDDCVAWSWTGCGAGAPKKGALAECPSSISAASQGACF